MRADAPTPSLHATARSVASGRDPDPARAAAAALAGADHPRLLVLFAPGDLAAAGAELAAAAPDVPVVGCATPPGSDVVVAVLGGEGFSVSTTAVGSAGGLREAGAEAAACLGDVADRPHQALVLFVTGVDGDPQDAVRGAYSVAGAGVPFAGGGSVPSVGGGVLLHNGETHTGGVVAAAIGSHGPFGVGVRHGLTPRGEPLLVTRADGPRVLELDGRPALDVYRERLPGAAGCAGGLVEAARPHPLGLRRRDGEAHVRTVIDADLDDGSLLFLGGVPEGSLAWIMGGGDPAATAGAACAEAVARLDGAAPRGLLVFESITRGCGLGDDDVARHAGGVAVARGRTAGQIARMRGVAGFHNQSFAVLAIG